MRNGTQTAESAREAANSFVREQFRKAWAAETRSEALKEFGIALHTLQDSTSPAHGDFQEWTGQETKSEVLSHVTKEVVNPGSDSELYKITKDAWEWFEAKELPEGDLFRRGID